MKKILYIVTSDSFMKAFNLPYLKWFKCQGYEVHAAFENRFGYEIPYCDQVIHLPFKRNPFHPANYRVYRSLKKQIDKEKYDLIHCHTPVPAAITRLAAVGTRKMGTQILYTAHGFHFFKGASLKNWLIYFTAEMLLSRLTDGIVTINKDDYNLAKLHFKKTKVFYISGVGVDTNRYQLPDPSYIKECREALGFQVDDFVLLYTAEFIPRKNHQFILEALPKLLQEIPDLKVLFAGRGKLMKDIEALAVERGLSANVHFLGFRQDLESILPAADVCVSVSKQEGLPIGLSEAMMCAKPVVASKIRGHVDLVDHGRNGFLFDPGDLQDFNQYILKIHHNQTLRKQLGNAAWDTIQEFSISRSLNKMQKIYCFFLEPKKIAELIS